MGIGLGDVGEIEMEIKVLGGGLFLYLAGAMCVEVRNV